jgi:hypothetical protein
MALEAAFQTLVVQINKLRGDLNVLLVTLGDRPTAPEAPLAVELENVVLDTLSTTEVARSAARAAANAASFPANLSRTRHALARCQGEFDEVERQFLNKLDCPEKLSHLTSLGLERGQEWKLWARMMNDAIKQVRQPLEDASKALTACWQEMVEHSGGTFISAL